MGGMIIWHIAMGIWLIGSCFPWLMNTDYVLKFRGVPLFRGLVFVGTVTGIAWAVHYEVKDSLIFFVLIAFINLGHLGYIAGIQPNMVLDVICKKGKFIHMEPSIHQLYMGKFGGPNALDRKMFCKLTEDRATLRKISANDFYMKQGTDNNSLSILLSGKMHITETVHAESMNNTSMAVARTNSRKQVFVGVIYPMDFINHLEWIARQQGSTNRSRISIQAVEECMVLEWKREFLQETFKQFPQLGACVTSLLGKELAEKTQLLAGGQRNILTSEFVHHVYCGCNYKPRRDASDQEIMTTASEKHPEYLWETAKIGYMVNNGSNRTLSLKPEQWIMRYAIGDGPWVDLDPASLMNGLHLLYHRVTTQQRGPKVCERELNIAKNFLLIKIGGYSLADHIAANSAMEVDQTLSEDDNSSLRQLPWVQVFAIMAQARLSTEFKAPLPDPGEEPTRYRALEELRGNLNTGSAAPDAGSTFGTASQPGSGNSNGTEMNSLSDAGSRATSGMQPTFLEYIIQVYNIRMSLQREIDLKIADPDFTKRLMDHGAESTAIQAEICKRFNDFLNMDEEIANANFNILHPHRLNNLVNAEQNKMRQNGMRVVNARLLGVDPSMLITHLHKDQSSLVHSKYFMDLMDFMVRYLPNLHHRELMELFNWGKWRTYHKPGTVFLRQGEYPAYVGVVLDGLLVSHTEDAVTRGRVLTHVMGKNKLIGSEDFQNRESNNGKKNQLRTARRTLQVPTKEMLENVPKELLTQLKSGLDPMQGDLLTRQFAKNPVRLCDVLDDPNKLEEYGLTIDADFKQRCENAKAEKESNHESDDGEAAYKEEIVLSRPTVMFVWEFDDLQRLMAADPHVYQALSVLLGCDLSEKRRTAAEDSLGSMWCGVSTHAADDNGINGGMCGSREDFTSIETLSVSILDTPHTNSTAAE
jgi:CRP-like cAMP-binding protein